MQTPTEPVKRVCYADDMTVWATGVKIPDLKDSVNNYLEEIIAYLNRVLSLGTDMTYNFSVDVPLRI